MVKLIEEWDSENAYDINVNEKGNLELIRTDTNPTIEVKKEVLPSNSATKQILKDLKQHEMKIAVIGSRKGFTKKVLDIFIEKERSNKVR